SNNASNYSMRREHFNSCDMELYRIEVGRDDGVEVRHILGAIANEADINSRYIGNIKLFSSYSTIELPKGIPNQLLNHLTRIRILNKPIQIQLLGDVQSFKRRYNKHHDSSELSERGRRFNSERGRFYRRNEIQNNVGLRRRGNHNI
ncbi:MAG: DbpA RNA binding domain-containing protein, partial [Arsenophonus sp. ET-DL9-MAG3]